MRSGIIAQKVGMTRIFTDAGDHVPVTVLKVEGCQVVAHRTQDKNGYTALQLGIGRAKVKNVPKAERARFAVANVEPKLKLAEFRVTEDKLIPVGAEITADHFLVGQFVDVTGVTLSKEQLAVSSRRALEGGLADLRPMPRTLGVSTRCSGRSACGFVGVAMRGAGIAFLPG